MTMSIASPTSTQPSSPSSTMTTTTMKMTTKTMLHDKTMFLSPDCEDEYHSTSSVEQSPQPTNGNNACMCSNGEPHPTKNRQQQKQPMVESAALPTSQQPATQGQKQQHKQQQKQRYSVTFDSSHVVYIPNPLTKPQLRKLWYTDSEQRALKAGHLKDTQKLLTGKTHKDNNNNNRKKKRSKQEQQQDAPISLETKQIIHNVFHACTSQRSFVVERVDPAMRPRRTGTTSQQQRQEEQRQHKQQQALPLVKCYQESIELVGLERQILGFHGSTIRATRRCDLWKAIQDIQQQQHKREQQQQEQQQEQALRKVCERISRPSRIFATRIAIAALAATAVPPPTTSAASKNG